MASGIAIVVAHPSVLAYLIVVATITLVVIDIAGASAVDIALADRASAVIPESLVAWDWESSLVGIP